MVLIFFEKSSYKPLFKLFNLIMSSFWFGRLIKIAENASALLRFLLIGNALPAY